MAPEANISYYVQLKSTISIPVVLWKAKSIHGYFKKNRLQIYKCSFQ